MYIKLWFRIVHCKYLYGPLCVYAETINAEYCLRAVSAILTERKGILVKKVFGRLTEGSNIIIICKKGISTFFHALLLPSVKILLFSI